VEASRKSPRVIFDLSNCGELSNAGVVVIGAALVLLQENHVQVGLRDERVLSPMGVLLRQSGIDKLADDFNVHAGKSTAAETSGRFRSDSVLRHDPAETDLVSHLRRMLAPPGWPKLPNLTRSRLIQRIYEVFSNAFLHSESSTGVFSCVRRAERPRRLDIVILDVGIGVTDRVRGFRDDLMAADEALEWAFRLGTTTRMDPEMRFQTGGVGLASLRKFVDVHHGRLELLANDGFVWIDSSPEASGIAPDGAFRCLPFACPALQGTLVDITLDWSSLMRRSGGASGNGRLALTGN
jgi:anti-sigma regulatory factor (Ser/Thr protein kinase)